MKLQTVFLSCCVTLFIAFTSLICPAHGASAQSVETVRLFDTNPRDALVNPTSVHRSHGNQLAVWDRSLQEYVRLSRFDTSGTIPPSTRSFDQVIQRYLEAHMTRKWSGAKKPTGFWGTDERFWIIHSQPDSDSAVFRSLDGDHERILNIAGHVRSVVPHQSYWYVQTDTGPLYRVDPMAPNNSTDTAALRIHGRLVGISDEGQFVTTTRNEVRVYNDRSVQQSRVFQNLRGVAYNEGSIYVLKGPRQVIKLNQNLSIQFRFQLLGSTFRDLTVRNGHLFLVGPEGLFETNTGDIRRSFFSATKELRPDKILGTYPQFFDEAMNSRMWVRSPLDVYLQSRSREYQRIHLGDTKITNKKNEVTNSELPLNAFQYFQSRQSFWNRNDRLYYFYPDEQSIEAYNSSGKLLRRTKISSRQYQHIQKVQFLGADRERILFEGEILFPELGFRRAVLVYSWKGNLKRSFRLQKHHSLRFSDALGPRSRWRYDGNGHIYVLGMDYIQRFDLWGYPGRVFNTVSRPLDLMVTNGKIAVLDLNGWQLKLFDRGNVNHYRFATPPRQLGVSGATTISSQRAILSAIPSIPSERSGSKIHKRSIYMFNPTTFEYRAVFEHPNRSFRYPSVNDDADTLFFWATREDESTYRLYTSDLTQLSARPTRYRFHPSGPGLFDSGRNLLIFPGRSKPLLENRPDSRSYYYYLSMGDSIQPLKNSARLRQLVQGGFTGYYGIEKYNNDYRLVSGYLHRRVDTGPLAWARSDTLAEFSQPVTQLLYENGRLYVTSRTENGLARTGVINVGNRSFGSPEIVWKQSYRGNVRWVRPGDDRSLILHRSSPARGNLAMLYTEDPPTGGIQGSLVTDGPANLQGATLRIDPGGQRLRTSSGGNFSVDEVPVGYVRMMTEGHRMNFAYPVHVPVRENEFSILSNVSVRVEEDLLLFRRGLNDFSEGKFRQARIALEAYRNLIEEGPYYELASLYLTEIYRREGRVNSLVTLFKRMPKIFRATDIRYLYRRVSSPEDRRMLLDRFDRPWNSHFREFLQYQKQKLRNTTGSSPAIRPVEHRIISHDRGDTGVQSRPSSSSQP